MKRIIDYTKNQNNGNHNRLQRVARNFNRNRLLSKSNGDKTLRLASNRNHSTFKV